MPEPLVSILLTSFNHERFIEEAITSVLNQSFSNFELIIWDDASTDRSWERIQAFRDQRIRAHRNPTNSCATGLKDVLMAANGDLIAIHHSDDSWEPNKLAEQVKVLQDSPEIGACFTQVAVIDQEGLPISNADRHYTAVFNQPNKTRHEWLWHLFFYGNALCHPSVLIRKQCYEVVGTYNEGLYQLPDYHMWIRLCLHYDIEVIPQPLTRFRVNTQEYGSMSAPTMNNIIRHRHEIPHALEAFCGISLSDLLQTFPGAEKFQGTPAQDSVVNYMLAMVALTSEYSSHTHRSFGANLLTRCWMDDALRDKLYAVHGLTRHQLRDPEILVDHFNSIQLSSLTNQLQEVTSRPEVGNHLAESASVARRLVDEINHSDSLSVLKAIQASIPERSFHLFNHILYDIRTTIGDRPCTYLEIGSYCGASALLMLAHRFETQVLCVDPLCLPPAHFGGTKSQDETLYDNLSKLGKSQNFEVIKSFSQEASLIEALYRQMISVDILFIDGDHSYSAVISDFQTYEPLVASGGYIIFDDYNDYEHSPDVHHAVNELARRYRDDSRFEIIGPIPDLQHCNPGIPDGNEFVIYKR